MGLDTELRSLFSMHFLWSIGELMRLTENRYAKSYMHQTISNIQNINRCGSKGPILLKRIRCNDGITRIGTLDAIIFKSGDSII